MIRLYMGNTLDEDLWLTRKSSRGYKYVVFCEGLSFSNQLEFQTENNTLQCYAYEGVPEPTSVADIGQTFICKEFGVEKGSVTELSVIVCDNNFMIVTLYKGSVCVDLGNGELTNLVSAAPEHEISFDDLCWVNTLSLVQYMTEMVTIPYANKSIWDWELFMTVAEGNGALSFGLQLNKCIDLSIGYTAGLEKGVREGKIVVEQATPEEPTPCIVEPDTDSISKINASMEENEASMGESAVATTDGTEDTKQVAETDDLFGGDFDDEF